MSFAPTEWVTEAGNDEAGAVLFGELLQCDPAEPKWLNRDRFILSAGHGSMFLYGWLHLSGYDLPLEQVKNFRALHSMTPGHPEFHETPGVESTTGPLGQGVGNAVGYALSAKMAAAKYNIEVKVCNRPEDVYKGAHILAAVTDSAVEVTDGSFLEKGTHMVVVGGTGKPDAESLRRVDVYLRFGDTPAPVGHPELATDAEHIGFEARPRQNKYGDGRRSRIELRLRARP